MSDGIVLVGLPGSGKTTVGRCLAERLGRPFVDTDERVRELSGRTPAQLIEESGETGFREVEARAVAAAIREPHAVISVGGGAVSDPLNRWRLWGHGTAAWLRAPEEVLAHRLRADPQPRPLVAGDTRRRLGELARTREPFYRAADVWLDASPTPNAVVDQLLTGRPVQPGPGRRLFDAQVARHHLQGPTHGRVLLGRDVDAAMLEPLLSELRFPRSSLILDRRAAAALPGLVAALPADRRLEIGGGERQKRPSRLVAILAWLAQEGAERSDAIFAMGGGTVGDLVGLAAALYMRGAPLVHVPTTWLAQADAALGGKVAIDLPGAKNAVGAFWPAWATIADVAALRALRRARLLDGMAESLKSGLIGDPDLWELIERAGAAAIGGDEMARYAMVERAARVKLAVIEADPFETGLRRQLNLGHTLGHALEVASNYRLPHGAAVILGLRAVAHIAAGRGADPTLAPRIDDLAARLGFTLRTDFDRAHVRRALTTDKKRVGGRLRWLLPMEVGRVEEVDDVSDRELEQAMKLIADDR